MLTIVASIRLGLALHVKNRQDIAYYYPAPYWPSRDSGWAKSLLLFFDKISILLPGYMYGRHQAADPSLAGPLEDLGLLEVLEPNEWIDHDIANKLAKIIYELLDNGVFEDLPQECYFQELSQSRIGYGADVDIADFLVMELQAKGLARPSEDGVSIPLHPTVRTTILVTIAQLSRLVGDRRGISIHPTTNNHKAIRDLIDTLSREQMPSRDKVIALDLEPVSFNMDTVPLDELLQFREKHHEAHRIYMRDLCGFMAELADIDIPEEREDLLSCRRQEIADAAHDLQRSTRRALGRNLPPWSLGLAGSAWSVATGDPIGAALGVGSLVSSFVGSSRKVITAYSYLFEVQQTLAR